MTRLLVVKLPKSATRHLCTFDGGHSVDAVALVVASRPGHADRAERRCRAHTPAVTRPAKLRAVA